VTRSLLRGERRAGILLHPTSLPGTCATGVLDANAHRFVDWLAAAGFQLWQTLPLNPVSDGLSPYQSCSAFAGDPRLIDPGSGLAPAGDWPARQAALHEAWLRFGAEAGPDLREDYQAYWRDQRGWLLPYALFMAARARFGTEGWWTWPGPVRQREPAAIARLLADATEAIRETAFQQWLFDRQWLALKRRAGALGIELLGDLPIYVDLDSVDVWWHRSLFRVAPDGAPAAVAGVPPDYFSADGQLWGNPLYDWAAMAADDWRWWISRVQVQLRRFDYLRIDHFRALEAYWEVPAGASTAREGRWQPAPGSALLDALARATGGQPFLAEDLGTITPAVHALRRRFGLPGMLVAQFGFDGSADNPYLPANHVADAVLYPGTHDNNTVAGWYASLDDGARAHVQRVLGCGPDEVPAALLRATWQSPAEIAIFPFQDLLGLGAGARMNVPGTVAGNWTWRFGWDQVPPGLAAGCRAEALAAGRLPQPGGSATVRA
jgi:4-alpha-glucanotransferase